MTQEANFYFIYGSDAWAVRQRAEALAEALTADGRKLEIFQPPGTTVADAERCLRELRESLRSPDLFAPERVFWLRSVDFLADTPAGRSDTVRSAVEDFLETWSLFGKPPCLCSACPIDRRTGIFKKLSGLGHAEFFPEAKTLAEVLPWLRELCREDAITLEEEAAELLGERVGFSRQALAPEIEKLRLYAGPGGHITPDEVRALVPELLPDEFFEVVGLFYAADLKKALRGLERYFLYYREARPLLAALQHRNRLMLTLRHGVDSGALTLRSGHLSSGEWEALAARHQPRFPPREKNHFCVFQANVWYLSRLARDLAHFSLAALLEFQKNFVEAFAELVRFHEHPEAVMQKLFRRCLPPPS